MAAACSSRRARSTGISARCTILPHGVTLSRSDAYGHDQDEVDSRPAHEEPSGEEVRRLCGALTSTGTGHLAGNSTAHHHYMSRTHSLWLRTARCRYRGFFHGVRTIVAEQGIGGVYKGLTATILKQGTKNPRLQRLACSRRLPCNRSPRRPLFHAHVRHAGSNQAIRWLVFTRVKEYFAGPGGDPNKLGVFHTIAASVLAGAASVYGCVYGAQAR